MWHDKNTQYEKFPRESAAQKLFGAKIRKA